MQSQFFSGVLESSYVGSSLVIGVSGKGADHRAHPLRQGAFHIRTRGRAQICGAFWIKREREGRRGWQPTAFEQQTCYIEMEGRKMISSYKDHIAERGYRLMCHFGWYTLWCSCRKRCKPRKNWQKLPAFDEWRGQDNVRVIREDTEAPVHLPLKHSELAEHLHVKAESCFDLTTAKTTLVVNPDLLNMVHQFLK